MKGFLKYVSRNTVPVLILVAALTALAVHQLPRLVVDISARGLIVSHDEASRLYQKSVDTFGRDNITLVMFQDPELFTPGKLAVVQRVIADLESLSYVDHIDSLFSVPHLENENGYLKTDPFLPSVPEEQQAIDDVIANAMASPLVAGHLVATEPPTLAANVHISRLDAQPDFDEYVAANIRKALGPARVALESAFQMGDPFVREVIGRQIVSDQKRILPWSLFALLLTLILVLRRLSGALLPLITAGLSIVWTLALMAVTGIPLNVLTAIVPAILIIVGSTEDIHLIAEYYEGMHRYKTRRMAINYMANRMGLAVSLTFLTSYLGFLSIATNQLELLRQFGLIASTGLLFNFVLTVSLVPVLLKLTGSRSERVPSSQTFATQALLGLICGIVRGRKLTIAAVILGIAVAVGFGMRYLHVNNNVMDYFQPDSEVRQRVEQINRSLAGTQTFSIVLESGIEGTFRHIRYLKEVEKIQQWLADSAFAPSTVSVADYLKLINSVINEIDALVLPVSNEAADELFWFLPHEYVRRYVDEEYSTVNIVVRHGTGSSMELKTQLEELEGFLDSKLDPGLNYYITGEAVLRMQATDYMATGQAKSLLLMLAIIFVVIAVLFINVKAGLLALIPNIFPIIILFGVMGYAGIPIDIGTAMIAAIAVGFCVDNTMHFMVRYNRELQQSDGVLAMSNTIRAEAMPITATSLALASGFAVLTLSSFTPVIYFGALSAMVVIVALLAAFLITPIALASTRLITMWDMLSFPLRERLIRDCPLFTGMRSWQIRKIILISTVREVEAGKYIFRHGDVANDMFIILDGKIECRRPTDDGGYDVVASYEAGGVFGEVALVSDRARLVDTIALEDTRVLALSWESVHSIARIYPRLSSQIFENLSTIVGKRLTDQALLKRS